MQYTDYLGKKIHRWTIIKFEPTNGENEIAACHYVECKCECGTERKVKFGAILNGFSKSCGCYQRKIASDMCKKRKLPNGKVPFNIIYGEYKRSARRRKRVFNISSEEFNNLIQRSCFYCGEAPKAIIRNNKNPKDFILYNGIDRMNNDLGYEFSNCVSCCSFCNYAKRDLNKEQFLSKIKTIYENIWAV